MAALVEELPFLPDAKNPHVPGGLGFSLLELEMIYGTMVMPSEQAMILFRNPAYIYSAPDREARDRMLKVGLDPFFRTQAPFMVYQARVLLDLMSLCFVFSLLLE